MAQKSKVGKKVVEEEVVATKSKTPGKNQIDWAASSEDEEQSQPNDNATDEVTSDDDNVVEEDGSIEQNQEEDDDTKDDDDIKPAVVKHVKRVPRTSTFRGVGRTGEYVQNRPTKKKINSITRFNFNDYRDLKTPASELSIEDLVKVAMVKALDDGKNLLYYDLKHTLKALNSEVNFYSVERKTVNPQFHQRHRSDVGIRSRPSQHNGGRRFVNSMP